MLATFNADIENVSDTITTCLMLHKFCQVNDYCYIDYHITVGKIVEQEYGDQFVNFNENVFSEGETIKNVNNH